MKRKNTKSEEAIFAFVMFLSAVFAMFLFIEYLTTIGLNVPQI